MQYHLINVAPKSCVPLCTVSPQYVDVPPRIDVPPRMEASALGSWHSQRPAGVFFFLLSKMKRGLKWTAAYILLAPGPAYAGRATCTWLQTLTM